MNDPRRSEWVNPPRYPPPVDPAYAEQAPYAASYGGQIPQWAPGFNQTNPTTQLPPYWQHDLAPPVELPPDDPTLQPPPGRKSSRGLLIGAGLALLVVALVMALVLANNAIKTQTAVPPLPAMPESSPSTPAPTSTRPKRLPLPPVIPAPVPPSESGTPTETTGPAVMQSVVYNVTGDGRAISIVYIDTGDVIQTEFNVALPWTKEVSLAKSALHPANVTIVNIGHNVTCSVTVAGVQVSQRVGVGITICDARG
jgi:MmpS family membrane protein